MTNTSGPPTSSQVDHLDALVRQHGPAAGGPYAARTRWQPGFHGTVVQILIEGPEGSTDRVGRADVRRHRNRYMLAELGLYPPLAGNAVIRAALEAAAWSMCPPGAVLEIAPGVRLLPPL